MKPDPNLSEIRAARMTGQFTSYRDYLDRRGVRPGPVVEDGPRFREADVFEAFKLEVAA